VRTLFTFLIGIVVAVGLAGCDSNGGGSGPTAQVRFMHASADAGAADIIVDGETVANSVSFSDLDGGVSASPTVSEYVDVPVASGTDIQVQDASGNTVISTSAGSAGLQENARYTVIVAGAAAASSETPSPVVLRDQFGADLGSNQVGIRLVHGSAIAEIVDVYLTPPGTDLQNATPLVSGFRFGNDFPGGFAGQFAPQAVSQSGSVLSVTETGSTQPVLQLQVGGDQGLSVSPGQYITGVAIDNPQATPPVGALVHIDTPGQ